MLKLEAWMDIKDLHRQGHSIRTVAELTGLARNTVRRVLREQAPCPARKRSRRPAGKLRQVFDDVSKLPRRQQEHIVRWVSAFVRQYEQDRQ